VQRTQDIDVTRRDSSRGQSLVEFAIFVPVLAVILLMAVDLGRVYLGWVTLSNVARIGANYAAQNPVGWMGSGDASVQARYRALMRNDARGINCTLPTTLPGPVFVDSSQAIGSRVRVDLTCRFSLFTPLISNLVGDGSGNLDVGTSASFAVRMGSFDSDTIFDPSSWPTPTPSPEPTPTPEATPSPTPDPSATPAPSAAPLEVGFYGEPTSADSWGGGPPGTEGEAQIWGVPNLSVTFFNTTVGEQGSCRWEFGDGTSSTTCTNSFNKTYTTRGTYTVTLTVDGQTVSRTDYVVLTCKVPAFAGVRANSASSVWVSAGFSSSNLTVLAGTGNYRIGYQSLAGGLVNPPNGCDATIQVGPE
jgi:Flp pilus assembly protein TadG